MGMLCTTQPAQVRVHPPQRDPELHTGLLSSQAHLCDVKQFHVGGVPPQLVPGSTGGGGTDSGWVRAHRFSDWNFKLPAPAAPHLNMLV